MIPKPEVNDDSVDADLYEQPGHLIRRAHQIAVAMFTEVVGTDVTTIQYGILRMVHERPGIDQVTLAKLVGLDTSTAAATAARLGAKGLLTREVAPTDRRQLRLVLTPAGEALITDLVSSVHRMRQQLLSALAPKEQETFMRLLRKFVQLNNEQSRAPLRALPGSGEGRGGAGQATDVDDAGSVASLSSRQRVQGA